MKHVGTTGFAAMLLTLALLLALGGCGTESNADNGGQPVWNNAAGTGAPVAGMTALPVAGDSGGVAGTVAQPVAGDGAAGAGVAGGQPVAGMTAAGTGGVGGDPLAGTGGMAGVGGMMPPETGLAMDECGLNTRWRGDEYCINPPPPDQGFQIHIGPSNYDNPERMYVMEPGEEITENFNAVSGNATSKLYYWRQYRMRPGSHHLIVSAGGLGGRRLGGTQNSAKDNPHAGMIAPENQGVGMEIAARTPLSIQLHYMNYTDQPIIKEAWVNFWYRDPAEVREPAREVFSMVPMFIPTYQITPGQHAVLAGTCPITQAGRFLTLYGHVHANNNRFSAWRVRGAQRDLLYESFDWEHPLVLEYSSLITNSPSNAATKTPGGWNGIVDLQPGDDIYFECEITNATANTFTGQNEAKDDEMCILVGDTVGASVPVSCRWDKRLQ